MRIRSILEKKLHCKRTVAEIFERNYILKLLRCYKYLQASGLTARICTRALLESRTRRIETTTTVCSTVSVSRLSLLRSNILVSRSQQVQACLGKTDGGNANRCSCTVFILILVHKLRFIIQEPLLAMLHLPFAAS